MNNIEQQHGCVALDSSLPYLSIAVTELCKHHTCLSSAIHVCLSVASMDSLGKKAWFADVF
jgi:hypothetical protein